MLSQPNPYGKIISEFSNPTAIRTTRRHRGDTVPESGMPQGQLIETRFYHFNRTTNPDEPSVKLTDDTTGVVIREAWMRANLFHRIGGPARIDRDANTGAVVHEGWLEKGQMHRLDGPAAISYDPRSGNILTEAWFRRDQEHRIGEPAVIKRLATGEVTEEAYFEHGLLHRIGGPAEIARDCTSGIITYEEWSRYGRYYRADGAAIIYRDADTGEAIHSIYHTRLPKRPNPIRDFFRTRMRIKTISLPK